MSISVSRAEAIVKRELHKDLKELLQAEGYQNAVSIEMEKTDGADAVRGIEAAMRYVREIFR